MRDNVSKKGGEARIPVPEKRLSTRVGDHEVADRGQQATLCRTTFAQVTPLGASSSERKALVNGQAGEQIASLLHWSRLVRSEVPG